MDEDNRFFPIKINYQDYTHMQFQIGTSFFLMFRFLLNFSQVALMSQHRDILSDCCTGKGGSLSSGNGLRLLLWELPPLKFLGYYQIEATLNLPGFLFTGTCQGKMKEKRRGSTVI